MASSPRSEVTAILHEFARGPDRDPAAVDRLLGLVYDELKVLAASLMRRERPGHSLQPTVLVHDAYLRLVDTTQVQWENRSHFYGIAARAMRQILVDHARRRQARRRGGEWSRVSFSEADAAAPDEVEIIALHEALERLAGEDERAARVVELRVFGGLTVEETAQALGVSPRTVDGDWAVARMWLKREMAGPA